MMDLNEIIEAAGFGRFQMIQTIVLGGISMADGAEILLMSSVLGSIQKQWGIGPLLKSLMVSMIFFGVLLGNFFGGLIADKYGRKTALLLAYSGISIFGLASAFCQGPMQLLILRGLFGIGYGLGVGPSITLQVETCPARYRGHVVNIGSLAFTFGEVYAAILLMVFMPTLMSEDEMAWRYVTAFGVAPSLILFPIAALVLQESPHYYVTKGRHEQALIAAKYIATVNGASEVVSALEGMEAEDLQEQRPSSTYGATGSVSREVELDLDFSNRLSMCFCPVFRWVVFGGCYICFLSNFLFFGLTYVLPQIFRNFHSTILPSMEVLLVSLSDLPAVLLAASLLHSSETGHRDALKYLSIGAAVLMCVMTSFDLGSKFLTLSLPGCYLAKYVATAYFTLTYIFLAEVFPSNFRATALSICQACGRLGSITAPVVFELTTHFAGEKVTPYFVLTSCLSLLSYAVIGKCFLFELKNAALQEYRTEGSSLARPSILAHPGKSSLTEPESPKFVVKLVPPPIG